jgi:dihydropteridine reductase
VNESISKFLEVKNRFDAVVCVSGGWNGVGIKSESIFNEFHSMLERNVYSSLLAGHLCTKYLENDGMLLLTGAKTVFNQTTPKMLSYALAKSQVHSLALQLSSLDDFPPEASVVTMLP